MKPYSQDLRERVIIALEAGETQAEVAARFSLAKSTLEKWWYRQRDTGSCARFPMPVVPNALCKSGMTLSGQRLRSTPM